MSQATSPDSPPTCHSTSESSTIHSWGEQTQDAFSFPTETVRDASKPHRVHAILTQTISRVTIAERIPSEILCMIAGELEDPPRDGLTITVSKHQKNLRLILMKSVCKTWKEQLLQSKVLWQDIYFDTTHRATIKMAWLFLNLLEESSFNVYAISSPEDLNGNTGVQLLAKNLLLRLRQNIQNIRHCGLHTPSKELRAYLDLPSSKISYLNLGDTRESVAFSGNFPVLCELHVTTSFFSSMDTSPFPKLTTFSLRAQDIRTSLLWMLRLLEGMPRLATLRLEDFTDFEMDYDGEPAPKLLDLKTLALTHCDFHVVLSSLTAPNIRNCRISECVLPRHKPTTIYQFLTSPSKMSVTATTHKRQGPPSLNISIRNETTTAFYMDLVDDDHKFTLRSTWARPPYVWQNFAEQVLAALPTRFRPTTETRLHLSFTGSIPRSLYSPLLQLLHIEELWIQSSSGVMVDILESLMTLDEDSMPVALPMLRTLVIEGILSFTHDEIDVVKAYMNFRASQRLPFAFWSKDCDVSWWSRGPLGFLGILFHR